MTIRLGDIKRMRDFSEKVSVEEQGRGIEIPFAKILDEGEKCKVKKVFFLFMVKYTLQN